MKKWVANKLAPTSNNNNNKQPKGQKREAEEAEMNGFFSQSTR